MKNPTCTTVEPHNPIESTAKLAELERTRKRNAYFERLDKLLDDTQAIGHAVGRAMHDPGNTSKTAGQVINENISELRALLAQAEIRIHEPKPVPEPAANVQDRSNERFSATDQGAPEPPERFGKVIGPSHHDMAVELISHARGVAVSLYHALQSGQPDEDLANAAWAIDGILQSADDHANAYWQEQNRR